jgi:hypothetical protein
MLVILLGIDTDWSKRWSDLSPSQRTYKISCRLRDATVSRAAFHVKGDLNDRICVAKWLLITCALTQHTISQRRHSPDLHE